MISTSCLCGSVSIEIHGEIQQPRYCHCSNCRKASGSAYAAWGVVASRHFRWASGEELVRRYDSGGGNRTFCARCGSPLSFEPHAISEIVGVPLGPLDAAPPPAMHLWTRSKLSWIEIRDDLAQYETFPASPT